MGKTLIFTRRSSDTPPCGKTPIDGGFSLVEVLLALAIVSLSMSLVTVHFSGMLNRGERNALERRLQTLVLDARFEALQSQTDIDLQTYAKNRHADFELPINAVRTDVMIRAGGICTDGLVHIADEDQRLVGTLSGVECTLRMSR